MNRVVIVAAARTAIGRFGGVFREKSAVDLTIPVMQALIKRSCIKPEILNDVFWGCNYQKTYRENNLARVAAVKAGLPVSVPGVTIHRNCTSSMSAIQFAFYQIKCGEADAIMVGGTDSMSSAQYTIEKIRYGTRVGHTEIRDSMWDSLTELGIGPPMGITAENLAEKYGISRKDQDELALASNQKAIAAIDEGRFEEEIVPVEVTENRLKRIISTDEHPRRDITLDSLSKLKPSFKENGSVTAGNASGINDGSAGLILMSSEKANELGINILAEITGTATTGIEPEIMGIGPVSAINRTLEKISLRLSDIELFEINEAFAAQYLACEKLLGLDRSKTNVNGSGIGLGHPVGATGARIVTTLIFEMKRRNSKTGIASLCAGGGMGTAVAVLR
ncbi:thiolase family protein [Desulforegula conservatrix]|uniref:thiolase family protein n=1 Tax=Desulforegula conservatrix TaxID=153026 RepID=UPI000402366B|nr:thiolase family protein [Desulforegula conservatrix]